MTKFSFYKQVNTYLAGFKRARHRQKYIYHNVFKVSSYEMYMKDRLMKAK